MIDSRMISPPTRGLITSTSSHITHHTDLFYYQHLQCVSHHHLHPHYTLQYRLVPFQWTGQLLQFAPQLHVHTLAQDYGYTLVSTEIMAARQDLPLGSSFHSAVLEAWFIQSGRDNILLTGLFTAAGTLDHGLLKAPVNS